MRNRSHGTTSKAARKVFSVPVVAVVTMAGIATGAVVGATYVSQDSTPAGISSTPDAEPSPGRVPNYPVNAVGQSYGQIEIDVLPEFEPDLILATATNGREGYIETAELDAITGANVSSPEEAVAWQLEQDAASPKPTTINVYESDGSTVVGSFLVFGSG